VARPGAAFGREEGRKHGKAPWIRVWRGMGRHERQVGLSGADPCTDQPEAFRGPSVRAHAPCCAHFGRRTASACGGPRQLSLALLGNELIGLSRRVPSPVLYGQRSTRSSLPIAIHALSPPADAAPHRPPRAMGSRKLSGHALRPRAGRARERSLRLPRRQAARGSTGPTRHVPRPRALRQRGGAPHPPVPCGISCRRTQATGSGEMVP
jgi:hypothetical protein